MSNNANHLNPGTGRAADQGSVGPDDQAGCLPTPSVPNLALGGWPKTLSPATRTFVLATVAVPIVIYGLMPQLRVRLLTRAAAVRQ